MKNRLVVVLTLPLLAGSLAFAHGGDENHEKKEQEHFQMMKQDMVKNLDAQISALQKFKDCVGAAADHAALKQCREEDQAARKSFFEAKKQQRIKEIDQRQQELEAEKQELQKKEAKP